jgi:hypothetical protein
MSPTVGRYCDPGDGGLSASCRSPPVPMDAGRDAGDGGAGDGGADAGSDGG